MTVNALPICEFLPFLPGKKQNIDNFMSVECKIGSYSVHMGTTSLRNIFASRVQLDPETFSFNSM